MKKAFIFIKKLMSKLLYYEFLRYAVVGGISFLVDFSLFNIFYYVILPESVNGAISNAASTAIGFAVGLLVNYLLSVRFVFTTEGQKDKGKGMRAFSIFFAVGLVGLFLSIGLMQLSELFVASSVMFVARMFVSGLLLIWNYLGRKIFVYKRK